MYKIFGDYGYIAETLLEEFNDFGDAVRWAESYVADGDFGGHNVIEIATFADDGEYVVERKYVAVDYQDETAWYEGDDDFAQEWEY